MVAAMHIGQYSSGAIAQLNLLLPCAHMAVQHLQCSPEQTISSAYRSFKADACNYGSHSTAAQPLQNWHCAALSLTGAKCLSCG